MDNCGMFFGNIVDKEARQHLSRLIQDVFDSGFKNHMSDTVMIKALDVCQSAFDIKATVNGCTVEVTGGK
jgi:hypothetical protein